MMKIPLAIAATMLLFVAACQKQSGGLSDNSPQGSGKPATADAGSTSSYPKRYLVEYEMSGMQKGTETVYFDRWGWREAKYTNSDLSIAGISRKESRLSLMDGEWLYTIDLERRTGTKIKNTLLT